MSSFLPAQPDARRSDDSEIGVMLRALAPLVAVAPARAAAIEQYLVSCPDLGAVKGLLLAAGLIRISANGSIVDAREAAAGEGASGDGRCTDPLVRMPMQVTKSVYAALEKQAAEYQEKLQAAGGPPAVGTQCKRKNCKVRYDGPESNDVACKYCNGEPVFHEGFKYWSCCDGKKTLDFEEFLDLPGCSSAAACQWFEDETDATVEKAVRVDHFESGKDFVVSFFTKYPEPDKTEIQINEDTLTISTVYERNCTFSKTFKLKGAVVPDKCTATLMSAKIDVKLVKTSTERWDKLE